MEQTTPKMKEKNGTYHSKANKCNKLQPSKRMERTMINQSFFFNTLFLFYNKTEQWNTLQQSKHMEQITTSQMNGTDYNNANEWNRLQHSKRMNRLHHAALYILFERFERSEIVN